MAHQTRATDAEELLGREVGVVDPAVAIDHHDRFRQRIEDGAGELIAQQVGTTQGADGHQAACRSSAGRKKDASSARTLPASVSRFTAARNSAEAGRPLEYQPRCLRAMRTPVSVP